MVKTPFNQAKAWPLLVKEPMPGQGRLLNKRVSLLTGCRTRLVFVSLFPQDATQGALASCTGR